MSKRVSGTSSLNHVFLRLNHFWWETVRAFRTLQKRKSHFSKVTEPVALPTTGAHVSGARRIPRQRTRATATCPRCQERGSVPVLCRFFRRRLARLPRRYRRRGRARQRQHAHLTRRQHAGGEELGPARIGTLQTLRQYMYIYIYVRIHNSPADQPELLEALCRFNCDT